MLVNMGEDRTVEEILELRAEAASARELAATFDDAPSVRDLLNYAAALDREADELELQLASPGELRSFSSQEMRFEIAVHKADSKPSTRTRVR